MTTHPSQPRGPFRYGELTPRPRVCPGALVLCGVCRAPHALAPDPAAPTPFLLYYHCAARPGRPPTTAPGRHLGALGGRLVDGLVPQPPPGDGHDAPPTPPGTHAHVCPGCAQVWPHPDRGCGLRGMHPKRCVHCQARLAAALARWAHVAAGNPHGLPHSRPAPGGLDGLAPFA